MAIFLKKPQKQPLQQHEADGYRNGVVGSESDRKTRKSPYAQRKGRVAEDERGRRTWQDTIKHVKLSLMKTGIFFMSETQRRLMILRETGTNNTSNSLDENLEFIDENPGFDPYDSTKK